MKQRLITGSILAAILLPIVIFSKYIIYPITLSLLCVMAAYEVLTVIGASRKYFVSVPAYIIAAAMPTSAYFIGSVDKLSYILAFAAILVGYMIYLFFVMIFMKKGFLTYAMLSEVFTTVMYVVVSFTALSMIRYIDNGGYYIALAILSACITDIFAYITGRLFGKHKLAPQISPKKTVEGSAGGVIFAVISFVICGLIIDKTADLSVNYVWLTVLAVILSVIGQLGDLLASAIKREHGVKDFGSVFPGHGGVMDRFDSIAAIATIMLVVCPFLPLFG